MKHDLRTAALMLLFALAGVSVHAAERQMELLDRGVVALKSGSDVFISWRLFATDPDGIGFNVYRTGNATPLNSAALDAAHTNFVVVGGAAGTSDTYEIAVLVGNKEVLRTAPAAVLQSQYLNIPVQKPVGRLWDGSAAYTTYTDYSIYDGTVADLDGDGQYEIVFFWGPGNMKDNSQDGITGTVFIDAYKLDGTKVWGAGKWIDLGPNIRAGAHYQNFLVYDFDGDGKAEIIVKTAPGTKDTEGNIIDNNEAYLGNSSGYILAGAEYLSVFEGATGKLLATTKYDPPRHPDTEDPSSTQLNAVWGDNYGNRVDRFLSCVAYLDGEHPSAVMCRGYYTRTTLCAWDWDGVSLNKRWLFDTRGMSGGSVYEGQGNHNLSVNDVDGDGKDEIIYGAMAIDDDGRGLYTTGLNHGDAAHVGKFIPSREGLQIFGVFEDPHPVGTAMRDARTGTIIWKVDTDSDNGRGLCADIDPAYSGEEGWGARSSGIYAATGERLSTSTSTVSMNMAIYWDGDVGRELMDGTSNPAITKMAASAGSGSNLRTYTRSTLLTCSGASSNGGTKANPCLQADIFGDWREEVILRATDNTALRVYTTITPTVHTGAGAVPSKGIATLMHNKAYRLAIAWQNSGYNQPPHVDYFLGYNTTNEQVVDTSIEKGMEILVSFAANGGTFADNTTATKTLSTLTGTHIDIPSITRTSYDFLGWYFADGKPFNPTVAYRADVELRAEWGHLYTLTFDANGGTMSSPSGAAIATSTKAVAYEKAIGTMPVPTPAAGFLFDGWNASPGGPWYSDYTAATVHSVQGNQTLYARYRAANAYVLFFDANGGAMPDTATRKYVTLGVAVGALPIPTRRGYTFASWSTLQVDNGGGTIYTPATVYSTSDNLTLYAKWIENASYTLTFDANGGILPAGETTKKVIYDLPLGALPAPVRDSFEFVGWNTRRAGNGLSYTDTTICTADADFRLYAQWLAKLYRLSFDANGGVLTGDSYKDVYHNAPLGELPVPTRQGYTFAGWNTAQDGNGVAYIAATVYSTEGDITLYAQWVESVSYILSFDTNGGTLTGDGYKNVYHNAPLGALPVPVHVGYDFAGWNTLRAGDGLAYTDTTTCTATANFTLYAQWQAKLLRLSFDANGGTLTGDSYKDVYHNAPLGALPAPVRDGYDFAGWNTLLAGDGLSYTAATTCTAIADFTLYAQWTLKEALAAAAQRLAELTLYPNPVTNGELIIDNAELRVGERLEICTLTGAVLATDRIAAGKTTHISVGHLPTATYVIRIGSKVGKILIVN
ncbi:MAG: InlB B-repeat-containing protein [Prevotellaceae bacterium]|nr:InlB B-repeat-containing protein [Prevotellaceae bacterium]